LLLLEGLAIFNLGRAAYRPPAWDLAVNGAYVALQVAHAASWVYSRISLRSAPSVNLIREGQAMLFDLRARELPGDVIFLVLYVPRQLYYLHASSSAAARVEQVAVI